MSKGYFDVAYYKTKPIYLGRYSNEIDGFKRMVVQLRTVTATDPSSWVICFENTGVYSKALLEWLISRRIPCREENPLVISRSLGIRRGKQDITDAVAICQYVFEKRDSIQPTQLSNPLITQLKKLLSRRDFLVRQKQAVQVSLSDQKNVLESSVYMLFKEQNDRLMSLYNEQIKELEKQIEQLIDRDQDMRNNNDLAQSVVGVGPVIAAYMIAITENFTCFANARKFATYAGIAPIVHGQTGIRKGQSHVSHMANKKMKSLLSNAVNAAVMYDQQLKNYYLRKLAEGKAKGTVLNAVKNKLVQRVFATIKRQTPYVRLSH